MAKNRVTVSSPSKRSIGSGTLWMESSAALPLVDVEVLLRQCAWHDPEQKEGTSRALARMLRMGTQSLSALALEESIERLGASMSVEATHNALRVRGTVLARNIGPFVALLGEALTQPAFRERDLKKVKGEIVADIRGGVENDRWIAYAAFRQFLFGDHPYGRVLGGTEHSMRKIRIEDIQAMYQTARDAGHPIVSLTGAVSEWAGELVEHAMQPIFSDKGGPLPVAKPASPSVPKGRRLLLITKPERSQSQIAMGTLGLTLGEPNYYPMLLANAAFGGTFTSRLVREVRSARGFSYSASSKVGADRARDAFLISTHPSTENTVACIGLQIDLFEDWVAKGITSDELAFVKAYLGKSHAFDLDTPQKRVEPYLDATLHNLPVEHWVDYVKHVRAVTRSQVKNALTECIDPNALTIVVLGDAKLERPLRTMAPKWGVEDFRVGRYDRVLAHGFLASLT